MSKIKSLCFGILTVLIGIFIVPLGQPNDSADNFLGGCLMMHGQRIYTDFMSQHNPLMYYLMAWLYKLLGRCDIVIPRFACYTLFIGILLLFIYFTKKYTVSLFLLLSYGLLAFIYTNHLVIAETWVMFTGLVTLLLLWFHRQMPRFVFWLLFIFAEFSFITANPLYIPAAGVLALYFFTERGYNKLTVVFTSVIPAILLFSTLNLKDYVHQVINFNIYQYPFCVGSLLAIYRHYLSPAIHHLNMSDFATDRLFFEIILAGLVVFFNGIRSKKGTQTMKIGIFCVAMTVLLGIRPNDFHIQPYIFFALAQVAYFTATSNQYILGLLLVFMIRFFVPMYGPTRSDTDPDARRYAQLVQEYSNVGDHVLIYPARPIAYLMANRIPGSYYSTFISCFPEDSEDRVIHDITDHIIMVVVIDNKNGLWGMGPLHNLKKITDFLQTDPKYQFIWVDKTISIYKKL